ncbi:hypothetical protein MHU86_9719 [Fragilaria crotonensis]|nr:hypothetical protein MHU86_9719 [Fragilaria crotonensis]
MEGLLPASVKDSTRNRFIGSDSMGLDRLAVLPTSRMSLHLGVSTKPVGSSCASSIAAVDSLSFRRQIPFFQNDNAPFLFGLLLSPSSEWTVLGGVSGGDVESCTFSIPRLLGGVVVIVVAVTDLLDRLIPNNA